MRLIAVTRARSITGALVLVLAVAACAGAAQPAPHSAAAPAMAPALTVERFLRAANQNDLDTMGSLFGTRDGPVTRVWSTKEVDDRMFLLASLLRHDDYTIVGEQVVPGRRAEATQFIVRLDLRDGTSPSVPFTLVRSKQEQWMVEIIGLERITGRTRR